MCVTFIVCDYALSQHMVCTPVSLVRPDIYSPVSHFSHVKSQAGYPTYISLLYQYCFHYYYILFTTTPILRYLTINYDVRHGIPAAGNLNEFYVMHGWFKSRMNTYRSHFVQDVSHSTGQRISYGMHSQHFQHFLQTSGFLSIIVTHVILFRHPSLFDGLPVCLVVWCVRYHWIN